jgi:hypothetical protein
MHDIEWLYATGLLASIVIGYLASKKEWKMADFF